MSIGKRIEASMIAARKKPVDIARHLKISESAVSQWFSKDTGPKSARLSDLARFLGTTVDALAQDDDRPAVQTSFLPPPVQIVRPPLQTPPAAMNQGPDIPVWASAAAGDGDVAGGKQRFGVFGTTVIAFFLAHFKKFKVVGQFAGQVGDGHHHAVQGFFLFAQFLGFFGVVPDRGIFEGCVDGSQPFRFGIVVKGTPEVVRFY